MLFGGNTLIDKSKTELGENRVADIMKCKSFDEIKEAVKAFLTAVEEVRDIFNGVLIYEYCQKLTAALETWAKPYIAAPRSSKVNAVIVPPEDSPLMLLKFSIPINGRPIDITDALNKFITRCDEYVPPICDAITQTEITRVLNAAQKAYRLIDIVAPKEPLKILRFDYSHITYNSQCGLSDNPGCPATVMVYHPKEVETYNRVFIFAHELGHALHQTLTGSVSITPDGFDELNDKFSSKLNSTEDTQERFADAVALSILNIKGLGTHFPTQVSKDISPFFARYLRGLCENTLIKMGTYSEPLPEINLMWQASLIRP